MVKANELRIGNKIYYGIEEKLLLEVKTIHADGVNESFSEFDLEYPDEEPGRSVYEYDVCFGIPLTPEILERCGFEFDEYESTFDNDMLVLKIIKSEIYYVEAGCLLDDNYYTPTLIILYLHQLQNLYFALTGEELEIKELQND